MASSAEGGAGSVVSLDDSAPAEEKLTSTSCPVCNDVYTEPKILPCAHRFCRKCLVTWLDSSTNFPVCPLCKKRAVTTSDYEKIRKDVAKLGKPESENKGAVTVKDIPPGGPLKSTPVDPESGDHGDGKQNTCPTVSEAVVDSQPTDSVLAVLGDHGDGKQNTCPTVSEAVVDSLPTDSVLAVLADSTRKLTPPHVCSVCPNHQTHAEHLCLDCGDLLCQNCSLFHSRLSVTRNHEVKNVAELTPERLAKQVRDTCKDHGGQLLELYCPSHSQLMCLVCFAVSHSQCQGVETVADASRRLRQVLRTQVQQLTDAGTALEQTSASLQKDQEQLSESQVQVGKDISYLIDRLTSALNERQQQLLKQAKEAPLPLKTKHQKRKEEVDELRGTLSANQRLVFDSLQNASDASFLRVFGSLTARMKELTSQVEQPGETTTSACQCLSLSVDQYDILRIEELLRYLGKVHIKARDENKTKGSQTFLTPAEAGASAGSAASGFNPFLCSPRLIGNVRVEGLRGTVSASCKGDGDVLFVSGKEESLFSVCMSAPFESEQIAFLPCLIQGMTYVQGEVVMTTVKELLLFVDVTKEGERPVRTMPTFKVYGGITKGLEDTIVVSSEGSPCDLDVMTTSGHILRTFSLGAGVIAEHLCRMRDCVVVSDRKKKKGLLTVGLLSGLKEDLPCNLLYLYPLHMAVDYKDRLYITDNYLSLTVTDLDRQKRLNIPNNGGVIITPDGKAFTFSPSPPDDVPLLVYDFSRL